MFAKIDRHGDSPFISNTEYMYHWNDISLESVTPTSSGVFAVRPNLLALSAISVLLVQNPLARLGRCLGVSHPSISFPSVVVADGGVRLIDRLVDAQRLGHCGRCAAGEQHQKDLFRFAAVGKVDHQTAVESGLHRRLGDQLHLVTVLRVKLEDGS